MKSNFLAVRVTPLLCKHSVSYSKSLVNTLIIAVVIGLFAQCCLMFVNYILLFIKLSLCVNNQCRPLTHKIRNTHDETSYFLGFSPTPKPSSLYPSLSQFYFVLFLLFTISLTLFELSAQFVPHMAVDLVLRLQPFPHHLPRLLTHHGCRHLGVLALLVHFTGPVGLHQS